MYFRNILRKISNFFIIIIKPENPFKFVRFHPATITYPLRSILAPCQITGWPAGPKFSKEGAPFPFAPC